MYIIENFNVHIEQLGRDRMVRVYLPEDYDEREDKRYAVLYMHDGHNLFFDDTASYGDAWRVQNAVNNIEKQGRDGIIVVGIDCNLNGGRLDEYSPWENKKLKEFQENQFTLAFPDDYASIPKGLPIEEVLKLIQKNTKIRKEHDKMLEKQLTPPFLSDMEYVIKVAQENNDDIVIICLT